MYKLKSLLLVSLLVGAGLLAGCDGEETATLPEVTTAEVTGVTTASAVSGGNVVKDGGADITARGVCWSTTANPTVSGNKTENGKGTGSFNSNLEGLTADTKYFVRAYATNSAGTAYGKEVSFTTEKSAALQVEDPEVLDQTVFADETESGSAVSFTAAGAWTSTITEVTTKAESNAVTRTGTKSEPVSWVTIAPDRGDVAGKYNISINLESNNSGEDRSATITITCAGENISITVTQKGTMENGEVPGKKVTFKVQGCNEQWSAFNGNPAYTLMKDVDVKVFKGDKQVATATTNAEGIAEIILAAGDYTFMAENSEGWKNIWGDYVIGGIFTSQIPNQIFTINMNGNPREFYPGEIRPSDLNGDGLINGEDKVDGGGPLNVTEEQEVNVYVAPADFIPLNAMYISRLSNMYGRFYTVIRESYTIDAGLTQEYIYGSSVAYANFTFGPTSGGVNTLWDASYGMIMYTNNILHYMDAFYGSVGHEEDKVSDAAMARYYRAYAYSVLLNYFGGVPIMVGDGKPYFGSTPQVQGTRATKEEIENIIIDDCGFAFAHLPMHGIVNRYEALQLKARVLLNGGDYGRAFDSLREIIDSNRYHLGADPAVWGIDAISIPIDEFRIIFPTGFLKGVVIPMRYVETLLLYAESALPLGQTVEALMTINQLLAWEQAPSLPPGTLEEIRAEITRLRKMHLDREGQTFAYLKRRDVFLGTLGQYGASEKHLLLPIPQYALDANSSLMQNFGW